MAKHSTAKVRPYEAPQPSTIELQRGAGYPLRFVGRARLAIDRDALAQRVAASLRQAATLPIDEETVRAYASDRKLPHFRFEAALLAEAFKMVSVDKLIARLADDVRARMPRLLSTPLVVTAEQRNGSVLLRVGEQPFTEPRYVIASETPEWSVLAGQAEHVSELSLIGTLTAQGGEEMRIDASWSVRPGLACASFGECAGENFSRPANALVGCVAGDALARFTRAIPREISQVLGDAREPTFVNVERLLCLGRLTQSTRVYLLYWKRLRDYLIWSLES